MRVPPARRGQRRHGPWHSGSTVWLTSLNYRTPVLVIWNMSKTTSLAFACTLLLGLGLTGCRTNLLPEYHCKFTNARTLVGPVPPAKVAINTQNEKGQTKGITGVAMAVAANDMGQNAQRKLQSAMPGEKVQEIVQRVAEREAPSLGFPIVADEGQADTRLEIRVVEYGVFARSEADPASYRFRMYGSLTFKPEGKLIWEYGETIERPLQEIHVSGGQIGNIQNLSALSNLSDDDTRAVFGAATEAATSDFMHKLANEYAQARGENKCHKP